MRPFREAKSKALKTLAGNLINDDRDSPKPLRARIVLDRGLLRDSLSSSTSSQGRGIVRRRSPEQPGSRGGILQRLTEISKTQRPSALRYLQTIQGITNDESGDSTEDSEEMSTQDQEISPASECASDSDDIEASSSSEDDTQPVLSTCPNVIRSKSGEEWR